MSTEMSVLGDVTYLDHAPEELPPLPQNTRLTEIKVPSIKHLEEKFGGKPPSKSAGVNPDNVDDYYGQFYCPVCYLWRTSSDSRAIRQCGHVICAACWDEWGAFSGIGPKDNRLTTCPTCRIEVNHSQTREVDFRATRFNSDTKVVARLSKTIASIKENNRELRQALQELKDALEVLKRQRDSLVQMQAEMADLEAGVECMIIDD